MSIRIIYGNKALKEMTLPVSLDDFYKIIVQLLTSVI